MYKGPMWINPLRTMGSYVLFRPVFSRAGKEESGDAH
jgi:hypothetical protein